jgi:hypothetical protein
LDLNPHFITSKKIITPINIIKYPTTKLISTLNHLGYAMKYPKNKTTNGLQKAAIYDPRAE